MEPLRLLKQNPLAQSTLIHLSLAATVAVLLIGPRKKTVEIAIVEKIIEQPKTAPAQPIRIEKPKIIPKKETPTRAVFGASRNTHRSEDSTVAVKDGNTVAKAPDNEKLRADDPDALPVPTDEFLITEMPRLKAEMRIPYPEEAKQKSIQGAVVMDLLIDASGKVREAILLDGPGFGLNEAALTAVRGFEFEPAKMEKRTVAVKIRYAYRFVLEK